VDNQKTISKEVVLSGIGLHTGCMTKMVLKPAPLNYGKSHYTRRTYKCVGGSKGDNYRFE